MPVPVELNLRMCCKLQAKYLSVGNLGWYDGVQRPSHDQHLESDVQVGAVGLEGVLTPATGRTMERET